SLSRSFLRPSHLVRRPDTASEGATQAAPGEATRSITTSGGTVTSTEAAASLSPLVRSSSQGRSPLTRTTRTQPTGTTRPPTTTRRQPAGTTARATGPTTRPSRAARRRGFRYRRRRAARRAGAPPIPPRASVAQQPGVGGRQHRVGSLAPVDAFSTI